MDLTTFVEFCIELSKDIDRELRRATQLDELGISLTDDFFTFDKQYIFKMLAKFSILDEYELADAFYNQEFEIYDDFIKIYKTKRCDNCKHFKDCSEEMNMEANHNVCKDWE